MAQTVGKANYAASSARAKSRKSSLIDKVRMKQLLQQDVNALSASIADSGYRPDLDVYASRLDGAELIEAALSHNLDRDLAEVLHFCTGAVRDQVAIYAQRFEFANAKTVLRAIHSGADSDVLRTEILPEENHSNKKWLELTTKSKTLAEAIYNMGSTPWGKALSRLPEGSTLQEMEDALDKAYYSHALDSVSAPGSDFTLKKYLKTEIDHKNIVNILRSIRQGIDQDTMAKIMIPGGQSISKETLASMVKEKSSIDAIETLVKKSHGFDSRGLIEAIEASEEGTLDPVIQLLVKKRDALLYSMSHRSPVSVLPVVHYIESKTHEVQNLRLLVRGKAAGLSIEVIKEHMGDSMEIVVIGSHEFTLGFQLAGVTRLHHPSTNKEMESTINDLLKDSTVGIIVVDNSDLAQLSERLRERIAESITPTVLGIGTQEDNTLRESIKSALGVDLWK